MNKTLISEEDNGNYLESSKTAEILRHVVAPSGDDETDAASPNNIDIMETMETETESDIQTSKLGFMPFSFEYF